MRAMSREGLDRRWVTRGRVFGTNAGWLAAVVCLLGAISPAVGQVRQVGTARSAIGVLVVVRADGVQERLLGEGALPLYEGDILKTDTAARALIEILDDVQIALNEQTTVKILVRWEKHKPVTPIFRITRGEMWVKTTDRSRSLEVETPVANVAASESEFDLKVNDDGQTALAVLQGTAEFGTPFDTCSVTAANATSSIRGKPCKKTLSQESPPAISWLNPLLSPSSK